MIELVNIVHLGVYISLSAAILSDLVDATGYVHVST